MVDNRREVDGGQDSPYNDQPKVPFGTVRRISIAPFVSLGFSIHVVQRNGGGVNHRLLLLIIASLDVTPLPPQRRSLLLILG